MAKASFPQDLEPRVPPVGRRESSFSDRPIELREVPTGEMVRDVGRGKPKRVSDHLHAVAPFRFTSSRCFSRASIATARSCGCSSAVRKRSPVRSTRAGAFASVKSPRQLPFQLVPGEGHGDRRRLHGTHDVGRHHGLFPAVLQEVDVHPAPLLADRPLHRRDIADDREPPAAQWPRRTSCSGCRYSPSSAGMHT